MKSMRTIRKEIIHFLMEKGLTARDLASILDIREKDVCDHLEHITRSITARGLSFIVEPAECISCGWTFSSRKRFKSPGRCPKCKKQRISPPYFRILDPGKKER